MLIDQFINADAMPALEKTVQFAARRHALIAHNIANISTPNFQQTDVSVDGFQRSLSEAVERRRSKFGGSRGELDFKGNREVRNSSQGLVLKPTHGSGGILFHDRNDRDLERMMQDMVENLTAFRVASDLFKNRMELLNSAIRERL